MKQTFHPLKGTRFEVLHPVKLSMYSSLEDLLCFTFDEYLLLAAPESKSVEQASSRVNHKAKDREGIEHLFTLIKSYNKTINILEQ